MFYLIITTSINNKVGVKNAEIRKKRYIDSIKSTLEVVDTQKIKTIIVENNGLRETYLDDFGCDVVYTNNNSLNFRHKGGNELMDIKHVIEKYNIQDNDTVIKLTGRYKLLNNNFINDVLSNTNADAFVKFFNVCTLKYHKNLDDCVLGLFAIKCKYLKEFTYNYKKSPECEFAIFVRDNVNSIKQINKLDLECCFADNLRILNV